MTEIIREGLQVALRAKRYLHFILGRIRKKETRPFLRSPKWVRISLQAY